MTSKELITELYIGYFDRAPDPVGLDFWIGVLEATPENGGLSIEAIAQDFATQVETKTTYPFLETPPTPENPASASEVEAFINAIYDNLFDRAPDADGFTFWSGVLQDGFSPGTFILAVINGADAADRAVLDNKIEVGCAWVEAAEAEDGFVLSDAYIAESKMALGEVTADAATVDAGKDAATLFFQDAPSVALSGSSTTLAEDIDLSAGLKVADIVVTDDGVGANVLALTGDDANLFEIVGSELFLKSGAALDFETNPALDVSVTVDDAGVGTTPDDTAALAIALTDVNDAPSVALENTITGLDETADTSAAIKVADIVVSDDALGTSTLALSGEDAEFFEIVGTELFLKAGSVLNFETSASLDVNVEVDDATLGTTPDDVATLSLPVNDVNEAPAMTVTPVIAGLAEDANTAARIKVGDIVVSDDALGTNDLTLSGDDAALFEIDGFELFLKAGAVLDFESNASLDVNVEVDDAGVGATPDDVGSVSVSVTDVNEVPSVTLSGAVTTLAEDTDTADAIKMADIVLTDDGQGANTLSLVGPDAALFEIVGTELFLKAGTVLDFEFNAEFDVSVTVDDVAVGGTPDATAPLSVAITDVNEAPGLALTNIVTGLLESTDTSARIKVADLVLSDDALGTNVLALTGADASLFEIDGAELFLRAGTALDFDANPNLDVSVTVDDATLGGSPDAVVNITVAISDTNGAPEVDFSGVLAGLDENLDTSLRIKVGDIVVTDDALGSNLLTLGGADAGLFEIDGTDLFLKAGTALDFETNPSLDISVSVDDPTLGAGAEDSATASIAVTDLNEVPSISLTAALVTLPEGTSTASRIKVADIVVTDDGLGLNTLTLTGADAGFFEIDGLGLFLKAGTVLDFETRSLFEAAVTVDDTEVGASPDGSAAFALNITNVNEPPSITLTGTQTDFFEGIDLTNRVQVATIVLNDDGTGSNALGLAGSDAGLFEIDGNGLFLKAGTALNAATNPALDVIVTVDDAALPGSPDDIDSLSITIKPGAAGAATDATEELNFIGNAVSVVRFGQIEVADADPATPGDQPGFVFNTDPTDIPYAGVAGNTLSLIDTTAHDGLVSLGVIAEVDPLDFTLDNSGSSGDVEGCLGTGNDGGVLITPELDAAGKWTFDNSGATGDMSISIKALNTNAGGELNFLNTDIVIEGDVDLTELGDGLDIDAASTLEVLEGATLTLTVAQVDALQTLVPSLTIFGEGTVVVVGESDDSDTGVDTDFGNLATGTVDLSAVTLADDDVSDAVEITVSGALDDSGSALVDGDGVRVTQTIIGTAHNDAATVGFSAWDGDTDTIDVILALGADDGDIGDPLDTPEGTADPAEVTGDTIDLDSTFAVVQINADAGFDAVIGAFGLSDGTVLEVATGAEFYAGVVTGDYIATAATTNDGTAVLEALGTMDKTVSVASSGGSGGWKLIGASDSGAASNSAMIGSDNDDTIVDGVVDDDDNDGEEDLFTGNDGADAFQFNIATSELADFTINTLVEAYDREEITVDVPFADGETVRFTFDIGSQTFNVALQDNVGGVNLETTAGVATALADALDGLNGLTASATTNVIDVVNNTDGNAVSPSDNDNGGQFEFTAATLDPNGAATDVFGARFTIDDLDDGDFSTDPDAGDDDRIELTITLSGTVVVGETYSMSITPDVGAPSTITVVATTTDLQDLTDAFAENIDAAFSGVNVAASSRGDGPSTFGDGNAVPAGPANALQTATSNATIPANTIVLWNSPIGDDVVAFEITSIGAIPIVSALSSSSRLALTDTLDDADVDVITDFVSGEDTIDFDGLADGPGNYSEGAGFADFNDAMTGVGGANAAMAGGDTYFFAETAADGGVLFYDANGDGVADGAVSMPTVGIAGFDDSDIV